MNKLCINIFIFFCSLLMTSLHCITQELYIVVHGTWAHHEPWAQPGGDFFEKLRHTVGPTASVISFSWSGKNSHTERAKAAERLAALINNTPPSTAISIVAHSHGGNVAFLASQRLTLHSIDQLFALGAPIDCARCRPNMKSIGTLYNIFSFGDPIQTVSGYFERTLPTHPRCTNIQLKLNEKNPNHAQLHCPVVAHWLTQIPKLIAQTNKKVDTEMPPFVTLELFNTAMPYCRVNTKIPTLLRDEKQLYAILAAQMLPRTKRHNHLAV